MQGRSLVAASRSWWTESTLAPQRAALVISRCLSTLENIPPMRRTLDCELVVWPRGLTDEEMRLASNHLINHIHTPNRHLP